MIRAWHFCGATLRDGRPIPPDGEWLTHDGPAVMCESGLHASRHPLDALQYAPGATLCLVECEEIVSEQDDKFVCRRRRILARIDATALLWRVSREFARSVLHLWDAPQVVRDFLATGDESLKAAARDAAWAAARNAAARDAAWDAARGAAKAAARNAAWDAAKAAAWDAARADASADARAAASADAWDAARDAARDAASAAAWDAAMDAQRTIFQRLVDEAFCHEMSMEAS